MSVALKSVEGSSRIAFSSLSDGKSGTLKQFTTLSCFDILHKKNIEFHSNVRGSIHHEYNDLLKKRGLENQVIPGGENFEILGLDTTTLITRPDLYYLAFRKILAGFNDHTLLVLDISTNTFFDLLDHENIKHQVNIRGMINQKYNQLLREAHPNCDLIPGQNDLELLGMDQTTAIASSDLYFKAYGNVLATFENGLSKNVPISKTPELPNLGFDQPTLLTIEQVLDLKIRIKDWRSDLPQYADSQFVVSPLIIKEGKYFNTVTRQKISDSKMENTHSSSGSKICLPSKRELTVSAFPLNQDTFEKIGQITRKWQFEAFSKWNSDTSKSTEVFSDLRKMCRLIAECMEHPKTCIPFSNVYVCQDVANKEIQAIAITLKRWDELTIRLMATHPNNVRSPVNLAETTRVDGAGSALIHHLKMTPDFPYKEIYLESVDSALPFYKKMGFEELDPKKNPPEEYGTTPMLLRLNK